MEVKASMVRRMLVMLAGMAVVGLVASGAAGAQQTVRVGLTYGKPAPKSVVISGRGEWRARRFSEPFNGEMRIAAARGELVLQIGTRRGGVGPWIELRPNEEGRSLTVDGSAYRGSLKVEVQGKAQLKVVNIVGIEDYVRGVVPNEMFADAEAFKVQAVISRTLAVYVRDIEKKHARDGFDICATGHCQVYRGVDSERRLADEAVAATRGEVLTYSGMPIFSAYHANAGGRTQTVDEAWPGSIRQDFPYLSAVASPYDGQANDLPGYAWCYRWRREMRPEEIRELVGASGRRLGEVRDVVVKRTTSTGRVRELEIVGRRGRTSVTGAAKVRGALGVPSALFEVEREGGCFVLHGRGRGHGVGLSQHGALGMAKAGHRYDEILAHFYRGVELTENYGRGKSRKLHPPELQVEAPESSPVTVPPGVS
jgi:stage II sporulation protein D